MRMFPLQLFFHGFFLSVGISALGVPPVDTHTMRNSSFFSDHGRGWHWYEVIVEETDKEHGKTYEDQKIHPKTPGDLIKTYREELERRLHTAWIYPTPQNIKSYQEMQKDMMDRSKVFSTVWLQTVFQNPELDHTLISPVNQQGRHIQIDLKKHNTVQVIKDLAQTWGLFFFFSDDCPYCHQFAPIVKKFSDTYQWEVIAIQASGEQPLSDNLEKLFSNMQKDNGLFQAWGIEVLPSLVAVNPITRKAIPIAYGLTSMDEMENRIMTLLGGKR